MRYSSIIIFLFTYSFCLAQPPRSEMIKYISHNTINGDKLITQDTVVLQINQRMGDNDTKVAIHYSKGDKVSIGEAWIEDTFGNVVRKLKNSEIETLSYIPNSTFYSDDFVKYFELKHNIYPYIVKYSYKKTSSKFPYIVYSNEINSLIPVRDAKIIVETTTDQTIKHKEENIASPDVKESGNTIRYTWQYSYNPPKTRERKSSFNLSKAPFLQVVSTNFKYGKRGGYESWQAFGSWISELKRGRDKLPLPEKEKIDAMLKGVDNDKDKAKILYKYLQYYTRYIFVSINVGGMQTYPASYVCQNKYGDCKALTNYMQSMLKYAGIRSYYTLINAGSEIKNIDINFPSQAFNHVILTIPFEKDTVYLECTAKNTSFGYISTFIQGRKALLIDEDNSRFVDIPKMEPKDVLCTRKLDVNIETSQVNLNATEKGSDYELSLFLLSDVNKKDAENYIRENILSGSYDLLDLKTERKSDESDEILLSAECKVQNLAKSYGKNTILSPFPLSTYTLETPEKRETNIQFDYPEHYIDTIEYYMPGKNISKLPDNVSIKTEFGEYHLKFEKKENKFIVYKSLLIHAGSYTLEQYKNFYQYMEAIKNNENKNYYLEIL